MSYLHVGAEGTESLPDGWHDELVVHTIKKNGDGTITVIALVNVYTDDGKIYSADRVIRCKLNGNRIGASR